MNHFQTSVLYLSLIFIFIFSTSSHAQLSSEANITDTWIGRIQESPNPAIVNIGKGVTVETFEGYLTVSDGASFNVLSTSGGPAANNTDALTNDMVVEVTAEDGTIKEYSLEIPRPLACKVTDTPVNVTNGNLDGIWATFYPETDDAYEVPNQVINPGFEDEDLSATFKMLSDENNLYVLVEVVDDQLQGLENPDNPWLDDCVELFIDANNTKGAGYEFDGDTPVDFQLAFVYNSTTVFKGYMDGKSANTDIETKVTYETGTTSDGYWVEILFPWDALDVTVNSGDLFGFDIGVNDDDDGGDRDGKIGWYDTHVPDKAWTAPCVFGTIEALLYMSDLACSSITIDTPVESGQSFEIQSRIENTGIVYSFTCNTDYYLSENNTAEISTGDYQFPVSTSIGEIQAGDDTGFKIETLTVPNTTIEGVYYVKLFADGNGENYEISENNNITTIPITITAPATAEWTGDGSWSSASWNPAVPGTATETLLSSGELTVDGNFICGKLSISPTAKLTVLDGSSLDIYGNLVLESPENSGSPGSIVDLNENGGISISGTAQIQRFLSQYEWHYITSPVDGADANSVFPYAGPNVYSFDENSYSWQKITTSTPMTAMQGYSVYSHYFNVNFEGDLNSGNYEIPVSYGSGAPFVDQQGWNLIGNPYPSPIYADQLLADDDIENTIYYYDGGVGHGVSDAQNYRYYNAGGGGTDTHYSLTLNEGYAVAPAMQAFFVRATNSGTDGKVSISNSARVHQENIFYKKQEQHPDLLILRVSGNGNSDETAIRFIKSATKEHDARFDAFKMFSKSEHVPQIYSLTPNGSQQAINSLPKNEDVIPIYFKAGISGQYELKLTENTTDYSTLFIEDKTTGQLTNISSGSKYTFTHVSGADPARFLLHFSTPSTTKEVANNENIAIYASEKNLFVKNSTHSPDFKITVSDCNGKIILNDKSTESFKKYTLDSISGLVIVRVISEKLIKNKKIILK